MAAVSPYSTALALARPKPAHVLEGQFNLDRITAYSTYEDVWNNVPEALDKLMRAGDDPLARRYIPFIRSLIEATNRYLAQDLELTWTPLPGATVEQEAMDEFNGRIAAILAREEFEIKFLALKRWMLIKGDALLMLAADPSKPEGARMRILEVQPDQYFPIHDPSDGERVIGVYLASIVLNDDGDEIIQRIEYQKITDADRAAEFGAPLGSIFYRIGFYELDGWDDRDPDDELKLTDAPTWAATDSMALLLAGVVLPTLITSIPVYHFRNNRRGGIPGRYGVSEVQGLETILAGISQNATDEDQAIGLQGIGLYWTDSGRPRDAAGKDADWEIAPGVVIELEKDGKFGRVEGVSSVQPMQDHLNFLKGSANEATAIPEVAVGKTGQVPASGVALRIEFMPVISKNMEKEAELASKLGQLLFDLMTMWLPAYEGWTPLLVQPGVVFGDPLPVDRAAVLKEILDMVAAKVVSVEWAQTELAKRLGYKFPADMLKSILAEESALLDATGARLDAAADPSAAPDPNADPNAF
jgi:hypothetical protein